WQGLTALSGSWIGGGANMVALGEIAGVDDNMFGKMVIVDVFVANIWMGVLLFMAGKQDAIDSVTGANTSAIRDLQDRISDYQARTSRIPSLTDLILIVAFGFIGAWVAFETGAWLAERIVSADADGELKPVLSPSTWKFIVVTALAVFLSFTPVRGLEGAGASRIGSLMLYLLVASIGASANFENIADDWALVVVGLIWMSVHIAVLLAVGLVIRAPIFFVAVGSQANIGGAASAPIVASAFHPSLAPVGVLLAVAGYVLGTYAGLLCMWLLKLVSGA
ncbi:MAG: DUF819 family protein, partial [Planctomycetota bacterium]